VSVTAIFSKMVFVKAGPEKQLFIKNLIIQFISRFIEGEKCLSLCVHWKAYLATVAGTELPGGDCLGVEQAAWSHETWGTYLAAWTLTCWMVEKKLL